VSAVHEESEHQSFQFDDAAYVLGSLAPADRAAFEQHLAQCDRCRANVSELAELPAVLERADSSAWVPEQLPETLLPRLQREVRNHQRRRRVRVLAAGSIAACVIALVAVLGTATWRANQNTRAQQIPAVSSGVGAQVLASVRLVSAGGGTRVTVECEHYPTAHGLPTPAAQPSAQSSANYRLVVFNRAGQTQWPASWPAGNNITITTTSNWAPQNISKVVIQDDAGNPVFELDR
jgi:hypothetical protein